MYLRRFDIISARPETPILIVIRRRNALAVLTLIFIRAAVSLTLDPFMKCSSASVSRAVSRNIRPKTVACDSDAVLGPITSAITITGSLPFGSVKRIEDHVCPE